MSKHPEKVITAGKYSSSVVGSGCEEGKRFYNFFDVGSKTKEKGTDTKNKLFIDDNLLISGKSNGGTYNYTITEVRKNNKKNIKNEIIYSSFALR